MALRTSSVQVLQLQLQVQVQLRAQVRVQIQIQVQVEAKAQQRTVYRQGRCRGATCKILPAGLRGIDAPSRHDRAIIDN